MAARWRVIRTDLHTHAKTACLGAVERDVMQQAVLAGGIAGVLERSVRKMAAVSKEPVERIERALEALQRAGVARWWPELEILWVVEAADEQANGAKAWESVMNALHPLPLAVRRAFAEAYHRRDIPSLSGRPSIAERLREWIGSAMHSDAGHPPSDTLSDRGCPQESGIRKQEQEQEQERRHSAGPPTPTPIDPDDLDDPEIREVGTVIAESAPPRPPAPPPGVDGELHEIDMLHRQHVGSMPPGAARERTSAARLSVRDDQARANLRRELEARGLDGVVEVLRFGWGEVAAGRWKPEHVSFAFSKSGGYWDKLVGERAAALVRGSPDAKPWSAPTEHGGTPLTPAERERFESTARAYGTTKAVEQLELERKAQSAQVDFESVKQALKRRPHANASA